MRASMDRVDVPCMRLHPPMEDSGAPSETVVKTVVTTAVSVSLPSWQDTVGWAQRDPDVIASLQTGYPRFFIPRLVDRLAAHLLQWLMSRSEQWSMPCSQTTPDEERGERPALLAMVFPHVRLGWSCVEYLDGVEQHQSSVGARILAFQVNLTGHVEAVSSGHVSSIADFPQSLCVVVYPEGLFTEAKAFWQHTGFGISSRHAAYWSTNAPFLRHGPDVDVDGDGAQRGVPPSLPDAKDAADIIKHRIAELSSSTAGSVQADDVFLYSTGMSAIANSASALCSLHRGSDEPFRVGVFGFVYVDSFKVLTKVKKFECKLYGHASRSDMDQLERDLRDGGTRIHALYMEFPGNPLLQSHDLHRLHALSRRFNFHLVVDDTVGTAVNLELAPFCDVLCTSLTKMFSGGCNVMGGSVTVSPDCLDRDALLATLRSQHLDTFFPEDVLVVEANSRDFAQRMSTANSNAEALAERLRRHPLVDEVFYPRGSATQHLYERYKRRRAEAGYGFLLSVRFVKPAAAIAFYDALGLAKGPSLGTNFSLSCAYTWLAHAGELEWAASFGVVEHLVRMSVGVEAREHLEGRIDAALEAAGEAC
ncbi:hypothetical protein E4U42_003808 [Claviceps africana]|uniref:Cystathionine gamma-synthase n=1 Tax=Claviceps africana TaxID=83212 RepID=A0A8K0J6F1_9HYPO|nr:hypothetical protein E4U42_003808 [Claviceps africana]